jgi:Tol biopolymer transport system component
MIDDELRDLMASMASEMPPSTGPPSRIIRRARRRMAVVVASGLALAVLLTGGVVFAVDTLNRPASPRRPLGHSPSHRWIPAGQRILFTRLYRDGSGGAAVDDGYSDIRPQLRWSVFSLDSGTGQATDLGAPLPSGYGTSLRWSAGAARFVLERWSETDGSREIWTVSPDGWHPLQLTSNDADDHSPAWSPDGMKIAFVSDRADPHAHQRGHAPIWDLYVMNADGSGITRVTTCGNDCGGNGVLAPAWSPDGTHLAFAMTKRRGPSDMYFQTDLYVVNADGSGLVQLTDTPDQQGDPAWSPDGSEIAFSRYVDGQLDVFSVKADGTEEARLTTDPADDSGPAWSPDGRQIVFSSHRNWDEVHDRLFEGDPGNAELYVMNADGSGQTRLTDDRAWDGAAVWLVGG